MNHFLECYNVYNVEYLQSITRLSQVHQQLSMQDQEGYVHSL